jgi:hypothetical protein
MLAQCLFKVIPYQCANNVREPAVKEQSDKLRKVLAARRAMLESRIASLTKERLAHVSMILPADLRTHQLALLHAR